jgi:phage terminase small subunit
MGAKRADHALTPRQERFVEEYLIDLNATAAATRAGYSGKTAEQQGPRLLGNVGVRSAIEAAQRARSERVQVTADTVLRELLRLATVDIAGAFDEDGALLPIHDIPEDVRRAIAGIEVDEIKERVGGEHTITGYTKKVKFWDKRGSLELLGKHLKLFTDRLEVVDKTPFAEKLRLARQRAADAR